MVVCNSGPLIAFGGIDRLDLLRDLFGRVVISAEVRQECLAGGIPQTGLAALHRAAWIEVEALAAPPDPLLTSLLDLGEASAIELARHHQTAVLLMDEARGRKVARDIYGLRVVGTGRVLVEVKHAGMITQVKPLLEGIRANGYWISDKIFTEILRQSGEQPV